MARRLYSTVFYLLTPLICLRLWWRGRRVPGYRVRWRERFGWVEPVDRRQKTLWVHAVSVGETIAAVPLIRQLQARYPDHLLVVTTTTPTGSDRVLAMLGDSVRHFYAPYDLPGAVARFLRRIHPELVIIMETELWPNLIHHCHGRHIPLLVANARLSEKSARGYARFRHLTGPMLDRLSVVAAQHVDDGERFKHLGLAPQRLQITGNIKFDLELSDETRAQAQVLSRQWRGDEGRPVWLVASTHRGEDELILSAFAQVLTRHPRMLLVLVPRHPDRFDKVAQLCRERGYQLVHRSGGEAPHSDTQILLGDTMGELPTFFGACTLAFVGGSLVPVGGHNLLEPAAWSVPVLSGPHLFNFSEVSALLSEAGGLLVCHSEAELAQAVNDLLEDETRRDQLGRAACAVVDANRGAMARLLGVIEGLVAPP